MSNKFLGFFKEPDPKPIIQDKKQIDKTYKKFRWQIFYSSYIAYVIIHMCRKNLSIATPALCKSLNWSNTDLGILGSTLYITYGIGKFLNGLLSDKANVRKFLPTALIMSAISNFCFALSSVFITPGHISFFGLPSATILLWMFCFFWGANGWFQSMSFPPIAKSLTYWFSNSERATKWSIWSTSHQVGVFAATIASSFAINKFGWKGAFYIPSILCLLTGFWLFTTLRDKPRTLGLPDIEEYRNEPMVEKVKEEEEEDDNRSYFQIFKDHILFNPVIWMLAIAYIFVYVVRTGTEDWLVKYLVEFKEDTLTMAGSKLSCLAIIGSFGSILAGVMSDKIYKGNRTYVNLMFLVGLIISIILFALNSAANDFLDYIYAAMMGIFTAGPQMLIGGLCAVESSSKKVASAATGFTGMFGYFGAAIGAPITGFMIDTFGWNGAFIFWGISAVICLLICLGLFAYEKTHKKVL